MAFPHGFTCRYPGADPITRAFAAHFRRSGPGTIIPGSSSGWIGGTHILLVNGDGVLGIYRWTGKKVVFTGHTLEEAGLPDHY
jgi:hypothetical protein